jgi:hypothetical protein
LVIDHEIFDGKTIIHNGLLNEYRSATATESAKPSVFSNSVAICGLFALEVGCVPQAPLGNERLLIRHFRIVSNAASRAGRNY